MKRMAFWGLPVTQVTQVTVPRESRTERIFRFLSWALYRNTVSCVTSVTRSGFAAATHPAEVDESLACTPPNATGAREMTQ